MTHKGLITAVVLVTLGLALGGCSRCGLFSALPALFGEAQACHSDAPVR